MKGGTVAVAKQAAKVFAGRDWHGLSGGERALVKMLEDMGYLTRQTGTGFVGRAIDVH